MPGPIIAIVPFSPGIPKRLSGRDAARPVLARLLGLAERDIRYAEGRDGKPRLDGFEGAVEIHIAISHSGGLLAVYAGPAPAGLDLEWMKPRRDLDSLCQTAFSPARSRWILSGGERRHERFYRAWTGLEAGIKLEGDSIWSFAKRVGGASAPRRYWVLDDAKAGYALCLCSTGGSPEFRVYVDGLVIRRMRLLAKDAGSDGLR